MSWATRLAWKSGIKRKPDPLAEFYGERGLEQIRLRISRNPSIGEDAKIVEKLMSVGRLEGFFEGENIIEQGAQDNDVFFILGGEADIIVGKQKRTYRSAPNQVGEMAAIEQGMPRSATVRVRTKTIATWRVPGEEFFKIWKAHDEFGRRLHLEMALRQREQLAAGRIARENNSASWYLISIIIAALAGLASWLWVIPTEWTTASQALAISAIIGISFVFTLLRNPAFFWMRCFGALTTSLLLKSVLELFFDLNFTHSFGDLQVTILSDGSTSDWQFSLATSAPIILAMGMCALMHRSQHST